MAKKRLRPIVERYDIPKGCMVEIESHQWTMCTQPGYLAFDMLDREAHALADALNAAGYGRGAKKRTKRDR